MATIDLKQGGDLDQPSVSTGKGATYYELFVSGADAAAAKGSALAAADVIQVMTIPAGSVVGQVTVDVDTADTGTTLTVDVGDSSTADEFVDDADFTTAGYKAQGLNGVFDQEILYTSADDVRLTIATLTGANDDWEARVVLKFVVLPDAGKPQSAKAAG